MNIEVKHSTKLNTIALKLNTLYETIILKKIEMLLYSHPYIVCTLSLIIAPICIVIAVSLSACIIILPIDLLFSII